MLKVKFNEKYFDIIGDISLTKASNEVSFDDIVVDFTGYKTKDLPTKYQEIKIVDVYNVKEKRDKNIYKDYPDVNKFPNENLYLKRPDIVKIDIEYQTEKELYCGYLEDYSINSRKNEWEDVELSMTLLTPMKMATLRYVSIYGQYLLNDLIQEIFKPLIKDGFVLKVNETSERTYNVNWTLKSIENVMNILANTFNLWWYIDEAKNIYIYDINKLLSETPNIKITKEDIPSGTYEITPELNVEEYANQVDIKNARVIRRAEGCGIGDKAFPRVFFDRLNTIYNDEEYEFDNPIVFYRPGQYSSNQLLLRIYLNKYAIFVTGMENDGTIKGYYYTNPVYILNSDGTVSIIDYTKRVENKGMVVQADGSSIEDEDNYIIIFKKDGFFSNLITGFKFKGTTSTIQYPNISPYTETALVYEVYTVRDRAEIMRKKGVISDTGIVEKVIDANEKWFTEEELHNYAINQLEILKTDGTKVLINTDKEPKINVGDLVQINLDEFFTNNKFICSGITEKIIKNDVIDEREWQLSLINAEMNTTFIDLFRPKDTEEDENKTYYHVTGIYGSENVNEVVEIKSDEVM